MTTRLLEMQSVGGLRYHEPELGHKAFSDMSTLHGTRSDWTNSPRGGKPPSSAANYFTFPVSNTPTSNGHFPLDPTFESKKSFNPNSNRAHHPAPHPQRTYPDFASTPGMNTNASTLPLITPTLYPSPLMFTPTSVQDNPQDATAISPLMTRLDSEHISPASSGSFPYGEQLRSPQSSKFMPFSADHPQLPTKRRRDSLQTSFEAHSPTTTHPKTGRRRRSEFAEPGSARAIYLEKNRKAASKCRSKQKMQQEELVETARDVERKNRALKAEVEMLKGGMRELMDIVGQHNDCPDSRLRTYVQREADRLASGVIRPILASSSSGGSSFSGGTVSPETVSSSERQ